MGCGDAEGLDQGTSSRVSPGVDCPAGRPRFTGLRSTRHLPYAPSQNPTIQKPLFRAVGMLT